MSNSNIKQQLKLEKIPYWKIADVLGVHENTVVRKLRHELTAEEHKRFVDAIAAVKAKKETA